jgi:hypothetical protein
MADREGIADNMTTTPQVQPPPPSDTVRRLQVGVGGVVAVLLLVGLAEIIGDRTADSSAAAPVAANPAAQEEVKAEQPLVELGVQPDTDAPEQPQTAPPPPAKTTVPDLAPDPALQPARPPQR